MIDCIYIMHYSKLIERRNHLEKNIKEVGLDKYPIVWVDQFDREVLTEEMVNKNYIFNSNFLRPFPLTIAEIANGIAHNYIIENVSKSNNCCLILEDDIVLKKNFTEYLEKCITMLPDNWDILNVGGNYYNDKFINDPSPVTTDVSILKHHRAAMTCSYLLRNTCAQKIMRVESFRPFFLPIDTTLVNICNYINSNVYWCVPWIAYEGSKTPLFQTSLDRGF